jgi:hypothetical protein
MPIALHVLWVALLGMAACAGTVRPREEVREEPAPILSLIEGNGLRLGSDRRFIFALYDDGTLIHALSGSAWTRDRPAYARKKLTLEEKAKLLQLLRPEELQSLPEDSIISATGPPPGRPPPPRASI